MENPIPDADFHIWPTHFIQSRYRIFCLTQKTLRNTTTVKIVTL